MLQQKHVMQRLRLQEVISGTVKEFSCYVLLISCLSFREQLKTSLICFDNISFSLNLI